MLAPIQLDNDAPFQAYKIKNEICVGVLSPELAALKLPSAQSLPEQVLPSRRRIAQLALQLGLKNAFVGLAFHANTCNFTPSPPNPPLEGEG